jgi:hypothetical protein
MKLPSCIIFADVLAAVIRDIRKMNPESFALLMCVLLLSGLRVRVMVHFMRTAGAGDRAGFALDVRLGANGGIEILSTTSAV